MPESLAGALEDLGHEVDSVNKLNLKGIDNGTVYRVVYSLQGRIFIYGVRTNTARPVLPWFLGVTEREGCGTKTQYAGTCLRAFSCA
jgi:hypothetical protein